MVYVNTRFATITLGHIQDGKTSVEANGVKIEGPNKWVTLIQNASKNL